MHFLLLLNPFLPHSTRCTATLHTLSDGSAGTMPDVQLVADLLVRHAIKHSPRATRMEYIGPAATGRARCPHLPRPTRRTMGYAHRLRARCSGCAACCRRRRWLRSGDKETQDRESLRHRRRRERLSGEISCRLSKHHLPLLCLARTCRLSIDRRLPGLDHQLAVSHRARDLNYLEQHAFIPPNIHHGYRQARTSDRSREASCSA